MSVKKFSSHEIIKCAKELKSEDGDNIEYDRALCELLSLLFYGTTEHWRVVYNSLKVR